MLYRTIDRIIFSELFFHCKPWRPCNHMTIEILLEHGDGILIPRTAILNIDEITSNNEAFTTNTEAFTSNDEAFISTHEALTLNDEASLAGCCSCIPVFRPSRFPRAL